MSDDHIRTAHHRRMHGVLCEQEAEDRIGSVGGNAADGIGRIEIFDLRLNSRLFRILADLILEEHADIVMENVAGFIGFAFAVDQILPGALGRIGKRYEAELNRNIKIFTTALEPILILLVALVVGFVAIAILSAVFSATSAMGQA